MNDVYIKLPDDVLEIFSVIKDYGADAYIVGGCVRDSIMGRIPNDWDICTPVLASELLVHFEEKGYKVIPTGLQHGTITVNLNGNNYEITQFRKDGSYSDSRHPDNIEFTSDLELDLARRDFTINAMAYNYQSGLIDPYNGLDDIKNKVIRCVGKPRDRFNEDALRIMRAIRFACQLGFSIHHSIGWEIGYTDICQNLNNISKERINSEFCKMIVCEDFGKRLVWNKSVFTTIFQALSEIEKNEHKNSGTLLYLISKDFKNNKSTDLIIRLTLFFSHIPPFYDAMTNLRFDNYTKHKVFELARYKASNEKVANYTLSNKTYIKSILNYMGVEQYKRLLVINKACGFYKNVNINSDKLVLNEILKNNECYKIQDLAIDGNDLIDIGLEGKMIGDMLTFLLSKVILKPDMNNRETLLSIAKYYYDKDNKRITWENEEYENYI